jgi:hypothetical protein
MATSQQASGCKEDEQITSCEYVVDKMVEKAVSPHFTLPYM